MLFGTTISSEGLKCTRPWPLYPLYTPAIVLIVKPMAHEMLKTLVVTPADETLEMWLLHVPPQSFQSLIKRERVALLRDSASMSARSRALARALADTGGPCCSHKEA